MRIKPLTSDMCLRGRREVLRPSIRKPTIVCSRSGLCSTTDLAGGAAGDEGQDTDGSRLHGESERASLRLSPEACREGDGWQDAGLLVRSITP